MTTETPRALAQLLASPLAMGDHIRPLLDMLVHLSGLECAYLTQVDPQKQRQRVLVSQHAHLDGIVVAEGASAAWGDTLCRRALEQGVSYTTEAEQLAPPDAAVQDLGIQTYMGQPIRDRDGALLGTLCAVSHQRVPMREHALPTLALFAQLLGLQVEHDRVASTARETFEDGATGAIARAMDGVADRNELESQLNRVLGLHPWDLVSRSHGG